ncbi:CAP domain-containing protein [Umezawaea tangerina]|uniref:CAP domain-containing protein n=1 Tax=Umezawaea tangerina TaxID=84725 RepID=UPI000D084CF1|nr:CAP domain-containing protein [Umezawaea tangerina]
MTQTPSPTTATSPSSPDALTGPSSSSPSGSSSAPSSSSAVSSAPPTTTTTETSTTTPAPQAPPQTTEKPADPPAPPAPTPTEADAQEAKVVELTNKERSNAGCAPLVADKRLGTSARGHSQDMANQNYFDHVSKDGRTFVDRIKAAGYPSPGAENIAAGQQTPADVMKSWMESPGHRANILNCGLKALGVGVAKGGSFGIYWTQNFGW